jgi:GNAT superfamily N-acetyltransferase
MSRTNYEVVVLPVPMAESHIIKYKEIRLQSLLVDPAVFTSTYARESAFTQEKWRQRLNSVHTATVVVYESQPPLVDEDVDATISGKWVGIMTILAPSALREHIRPKAVEVGEETQVYGLFGMWTHPEHRQKGLGRRLVEAGLEWVRTNNDPQHVTGSTDKVVALQVYEGNANAVALYRKSGFKVLPREDAPAGEEPFMILHV